jgi:hypothetical protein
MLLTNIFLSEIGRTIVIYRIQYLSKITSLDVKHTNNNYILNIP